MRPGGNSPAGPMQLCKLNEYTIWRLHNIHMGTLSLKSSSSHLKMCVSKD